MPDAVLLVCHGTVQHAGELPAFLRSIRGGRPTPDAIVEEVTRRFERIGGSPLMRITQAQADAVAAELGVPVHLAGRHAPPFAKDVLGALPEGARVAVVPVAPQSVHVYAASVREQAAARPDLDLRFAAPWGEEPLLVDALFGAVTDALARFAPAERASVPIVLTAHSLPLRVIHGGDPYERQFRAMAELVADRLRAAGSEVLIGFQSQGMSQEAWLGPSLFELLAGLAARPAKSVLVAPIGFCADHVETLYDLDIEARDHALGLGFTRFERAEAMNTRPTFIAALAAVARALLR